ncbi:MAG: GNAT family N-acetyltransferase [Rhodobacteraceae bacterium]|nr:GNAT family N-acetyltransferase [Paracoccaceae bacterium]
MLHRSAGRISFVRLTEISLAEIAAHMADPRLAAHLPLLTPGWDEDRAAAFVAAKEACWDRDGLGHWAILCDGAYVGWGGFQKEGQDWDFGLVLKPDRFGLGMRIARRAIDVAVADPRIPAVTFLLPLSRTRLRGLDRLGARFVEEVIYDGVPFRKYHLDTP